MNFLFVRCRQRFGKQQFREFVSKDEQQSENSSSDQKTCEVRSGLFNTVVLQWRVMARVKKDQLLFRRFAG